MTKDEAAEWMYQALGSPIGVLLQAENPEQARAKLQAFRRMIGDPELAQLVFRVVTVLDDGNLIIVKKGKADE